MCATRTNHGQWAKQWGKSNPGAKTDESGKAPPGDEGKGPDPKQADPRRPAQLTPYTNQSLGPLRFGGSGMLTITAGNVVGISRHAPNPPRVGVGMFKTVSSDSRRP